jgi:hypothetical protein
MAKTSQRRLRGDGREIGAKTAGARSHLEAKIGIVANDRYGLCDKFQKRIYRNVEVQSGGFIGFDRENRVAGGTTELGSIRRRFGQVVESFVEANMTASLDVIGGFVQV